MHETVEFIWEFQPLNYYSTGLYLYIFNYVPDNLVCTFQMQFVVNFINQVAQSI